MMAWLIDIRSDKARYQPQIAPIPGCQTTDDLHASIRSLMTEAQEYKAANGFLPLGIHADGYEIPNRFWPQEGHFIDDPSLIPPLLGLASFYLVAQQWHDAIEEFEPGVHQFKQVPLTLKDGSPLKECFYAMNIRQTLRDVADMDRSTAPYEVFGDGVKRFLKTSSSPKSKVYFLRDRIKKYDLWRPIDILGYRIAMSNELFERISRLGGIENIQTLEIEEV